MNKEVQIQGLTKDEDISITKIDIKKIFKTGIKGMSIIEIASKISKHLKSSSLNLKSEDLQEINGIGKIKALKILNLISLNNTLSTEQIKEIIKKPTYVSLFSGAGIGCHGFNLEGFTCISTVEILNKRLNFQRYNNKCLIESGYVCGDIREPQVKKQLNDNIQYFNKTLKRKELDVLIATPPCQGMSVANHKKKNELKRNSLVIESITLTKKYLPKIFIFENVSAFLNTICTDIDEKDKKIQDAIDFNLSGNYHIFSKIINFKNYGNNSSRTRTLVIGIRKDQKDITPFDIFPDKAEEKTLFEVIGDMQSLKKMGQIHNQDIYHHFKRYTPHMRDWIKGIKEGQSAFDNKEIANIPHRVVNNKIVINQNKNGDKYKRQVYKKIAPCIHTRNDILSSQNTVHPKDDRVFSIRELMKMMTIPESFCWSDIELRTLNKYSLDNKEKYLKSESMTIRHSIGEAVPTCIFQQIAKKIKTELTKKNISQKEIFNLIEKYNLQEFDNLKLFIKQNKLKLSYSVLLKISEYSNTKRVNNSAYYTSQDIVYSLVKKLPDSKIFKELSILEPSVGIGSFLPLLIKKYSDVEKVNIDVIDIDKNSLEILKTLLTKIKIPNNIKIKYINKDFLTHKSNKKYDIVIGNPPFGKITKDKPRLSSYHQDVLNKNTNNIFSFFIEKSLKIGKTTSLIVPKSLLSSPEFNVTREILAKYNFKNLVDFGETGFKGVKIETIAFIVDTLKKKIPNNKIEIESMISKDTNFVKQDYMFDKKFPYWLIYRNSFFDKVSKKLKLGIFTAFRDRQITKKHTLAKGEVRVLKSRNIQSNQVVSIKGYDCYINNIEKFAIKKILNGENLILIPNLTYNPRACFLPSNSIVDGSVAVLTIKDKKELITKNDLEYFNTEEFSRYYSIARNRGTRSLNIDNNSVYFFGKLTK